MARKKQEQSEQLPESPVEEVKEPVVEEKELVQTIGYVIEIVKSKDQYGQAQTRLRHKLVGSKIPVEGNVLFETGDAAEATLELQRKLGQMLSTQRKKLD